MYSYNPYYYEFLAHHGVKGQKWGIRRYQPYTSANKGIFKNLRRSYKSSVRQIKKARRQYEQEGDELAVAAANKAIKDTKKSYKSELKGLKKEFKAENRANYLQDVAERGNEKQVNKVRKELSPDQLNTAIRRIQAYKDWEKLSLRDVEKEVQYENSMKRLDKIMKGADTVSRVATATISVTSAAKSFKDFFKKPSAYEKEKQQLELEGLRNKNDLSKAQAEKMRGEIPKVSGGGNSNPTPPTAPKSSVIPTSTSSTTSTGSYNSNKPNNIVEFKPITNTTSNGSSNKINYTWGNVKNTPISEVSNSKAYKQGLFSTIASYDTMTAATKVKVSEIPFDFSANSKSGQVATSRYIAERNKGNDKTTSSWKAEDSYAKSIANSNSPTKDSLLNYAKAKGLNDHTTATMAVDKNYSKYFSEADKRAAQAYLDEEKKKRK